MKFNIYRKVHKSLVPSSLNYQIHPCKLLSDKKLEYYHILVPALRITTMVTAILTSNILD